MASFSFYVFMDLDFVSVYKNAKRELGQYPAILTSHLVNNIYLLYGKLRERAVCVAEFCVLIGYPSRQIKHKSLFWIWKFEFEL